MNKIIMQNCKYVLLTLSFLSVSACSFAPDYVQPEMELPQDFTSSADEISHNNENVDQELAAWWTKFDDEGLNYAIDTALKYNYDLLIAAEHLEQAMAYLGISKGSLLPSLGVGGSAQRTHTSDSQTISISTPVFSYSADNPSNSFGLNIQAAWELDFWGKYRNATKAAKNNMIASYYGQEAVKMTLVAATAEAYITLLSLQEKFAIATSTLVTRQQALEIYTFRYKAGLINELDYLRASTEVDTVRTTLYTLEYQIANAKTALQTLMGESPKAIMDKTITLGSGKSLPTAPVIPVGIPSELLERRPDILIAEQGIMAANYQVGVAKAAYFPSISLTGLLGLQSSELSKLFDNGAGMWSYGAGLAAPLFQGGKIKNNVKLNEAKAREAVLNYQKTVQNAFKDVRMALTVQESIDKVVYSLEKTVSSLDKASELAQIRYDNGFDSYLEVLDAERSLFNAQIQLIDAKSYLLTNFIHLTKALGGGWDSNQNIANQEK